MCVFVCFGFPANGSQLPSWDLGAQRALQEHQVLCRRRVGHSSLAPATQIYADIEVNQLDADSLWHLWWSGKSTGNWELAMWMHIGVHRVLRRSHRLEATWVFQHTVALSCTPSSCRIHRVPWFCHDLLVLFAGCQLHLAVVTILSASFSCSCWACCFYPWSW